MDGLTWQPRLPSRRVHQIRGSMLSDALIDRGAPSDENAWIREARSARQSVFATCGCSDALDDAMSGWRQRTRASCTVTDGSWISRWSAGPGARSNSCRNGGRRGDEEGTKVVVWRATVNWLVLPWSDAGPMRTVSAGVVVFQGWRGAPQVGAAAERWPPDWHPAIPRSASHCRRRRPIQTQKTHAFF